MWYILFPKLAFWHSFTLQGKERLGLNMQNVKWLYIHTYIHTHIHTYIHTYIHMLFSSLPIRDFSVADYINYLSYLLSLTIYIHIFNFVFIIFLTIYPNPPCQLSLWEETGEPGENPRLSAECWRTLPTCDHMYDNGIEPLTSVVGGSGLDHWATDH